MADFPLKKSYAFGRSKGLSREIGTIEKLSEATSDVRRGSIIKLFQEKGVLDEFMKESWQEGDTQDGKARVDEYIKGASGFPQGKAVAEPVKEEVGVHAEPREEEPTPREVQPQGLLQDLKRRLKQLLGR